MKLKVFNAPPTEQEKEVEVYVRLIQGESGVSLVVCDSTGNIDRCSNLLRLTEKGILLNNGISDKNFNLDSKGCLKVLGTI